MKKISKALPKFQVMYISQLKKQLFTGVYGTANLKNLRKSREKATSGNLILKQWIFKKHDGTF